MKTTPATTSEVIAEFNRAFTERDATILNNLVAQNCMMESAMPAPDGEKTMGREACLAFWKQLIDAPNTRFTPQEVIIMGENAVIIWRFIWNDGEEKSVKGCNIMKVENGLIAEAIGFVKGALVS